MFIFTINFKKYMLNFFLINFKFTLNLMTFSTKNVFITILGALTANGHNYCMCQTKRQFFTAYLQLCICTQLKRKRKPRRYQSLCLNTIA